MKGWMRNLLESIHSPKDLKQLDEKELKHLSQEIRQELISTVSQNGGHLASNLGIVELTLALHRTFDMPADKIIFDVGHQDYVHKLVTGRYQQFKTLRQYGGLSGFPKRDESEYDCFETGHASTALSAALGMARARDYLGESHHVVAVVGDGALTGGMCYEALNDAGNSQTRLILVLNDNEMSIAPNVGALSGYLTRLRFSAGWLHAKKNVRRISDIPVVGKTFYKLLHWTKELLKTAFVRNESDLGFFEALGFEYFGPVDGHDIPSLERALRMAKTRETPCVLHVLTKKGYGYDRAEERPETFHGTPPFYIETGDRIEQPGQPSCGHIMADTLAEMPAEDRRVVAITAAMKLGTGLDHLAEKYPDRVLDTGITEEHAATMAAGLAAGGMRPYFAVYASFFQRCYDQLIHDVAMQHLPVVFLLDRSGIGGEDGQTHHGIFDFAETIPIPGLTVLAPKDASELVQMLKWTLTQDGPCVIRYSKSLGKRESKADAVFAPGVWRQILQGSDCTLLSVGSMSRIAERVHDILKESGIAAAVWNCSSVKPLDLNALRRISAEAPCFTLEEHMLSGGFGAYVTTVCKKNGWTCPMDLFGIEDRYIGHGSHNLLMKDAGLDPESIAMRIKNELRKEEKK